ncbi:hypothetical protein ACFL6A_02295 [bacterium]
MSRVIRNRSILLVVFLMGIIIVWSCAGHKPFDWGNPETGYRLSYRTKPGDSFHYISTWEAFNTTERGGQSYDNTSNRTMTYHLKAEKNDSLLPFILTIDTLGTSFESSRGSNTPDYSPYSGKRARVYITPVGLHRYRKTVLLDSISLPEGNNPFGPRDPKREFRLGFIKVPDRLIKTGDSWTDTRIDTSTFNDTTRQYTTTTIIDRETSYTVLGEETKMGLACLHIKMESTSTREMWGIMRGNDMSSEGEDESNTEIWFAYKEGILVEMTNTTFSEGTMAFSGQSSGTMPNTRESTVSLRLVEWFPKKR